MSGNNPADDGPQNRNDNSAENLATLRFVAKIRNKYAGYILRRHAGSVDEEGKPLSGLEPPCFSRLCLNMYPKERQMYDGLLRKVDSDKHVSIAAQKVSFEVLLLF